VVSFALAMRRTLQILSLLILAFSPAISPASPQTNTKTDNQAELQVKISTESSKYIQGDDVPIHIQITNVGRRSIYIGRDFWNNDSPSRMRLSVKARDGHAMQGVQGSVGGLAPGAFKRLPKAAIDWCLSLTPGYSYGTNTNVQGFVGPLIPGTYQVNAIFESSGIDSHTYLNPLLGNPEELAAFLPGNWKGLLTSNVLTITIVGERGTKKR
jgi:hypothetical protein